MIDYIIFLNEKKERYKNEIIIIRREKKIVNLFEKQQKR
jgi:hypothetical protein